ncbi:MAG: thiamine pyrophosphate-requiring protein [Deltaproteobacteria bacterium]|nr:thiamine pyrophosphate-requiring protein [Deltaproteobacteria bacterium]
MEISVETVAQAYLEMLRNRGIKYIFGNSGTDFAPIIDGLAKFIVEKKNTPRPITVTHENVAVNMAMGYAMITGEPQVVMAHVIVGAANAACALMNAYRLEIPMLFSAGRTPVTEAGLQGSRNRPIHWGQESFDQGGLLREFTKWDYELRHPIQLETVVDRALEMTMAEPQGPVYLILPREILSQRIESIDIHPWRKPKGPILAYPDPSLIDEAIRWLNEAGNPLIIASRIGKNPASVNSLVSFAEAAAAPILTPNSPYMNCPTGHPHYLGTELKGFLEEADLIVIADSDVPWLPQVHQPAPGAKIIHVSRDPSYQNYPIRGFPIDLPIVGDPGITFKLAAEKIFASSASSSAKFNSRREKIKEKHLEQRTKLRATAAGLRSNKPIHPFWVAYCLNQIRDENTILLNEYTLDVSPMDFSQPQSYFSLSPAGGLGWSIGAALGVKLAMPDKTCIVTLGDGAYIFNVPTACHYVSQKYDLPLLIIIINNGTWGASKRTVLEQFPDGWAATANEFPFCDLTPSPKYEVVVSAFDGYGETVEEPSQFLSALRRAIEIVRTEKRTVVLNVICAGPGVPRG